jgi:hypothetical protein
MRDASPVASETTTVLPFAVCERFRRPFRHTARQDDPRTWSRLVELQGMQHTFCAAGAATRRNLHIRGEKPVRKGKVVRLPTAGVPRSAPKLRRGHGAAV